MEVVHTFRLPVDYRGQVRQANITVPSRTSPSWMSWSPEEDEFPSNRMRTSNSNVPNSRSRFTQQLSPNMSLLFAEKPEADKL